MLTNTGPVAKLYLSIIDDVIESMRELFLDEGLEDRALDELRHLWESKMMQSKAMEDIRKNNINSSKFVLQLPANYSQADQELTASVMIPASQNIQRFPVKIPAGVTLQTASGQLYKVNVPVVVTQALAGQEPLSQPKPKPPSATVPHNAARPQEVSSSSVPTSSVAQPPQPSITLPPSQESSLPLQPQVPVANISALQTAPSPEPEVTPEENEPNPQPLNLSMTTSTCSQLLDFQISAEEALTQTAQLKTRDIDDILKEVIEEEREKAMRARNLAPVKTDNQSEAILGLDLDYTYRELSDIVQLDGAADDSDIEEEERVPLEENDFLGIINAEAIKALQEGDGSSGGNSISSSSDSEGADELADVEEEVRERSFKLRR
ncbi:TFIIA-alpha and beta-like factor [Scomber scombrus]|uniref:TFIIA-alpha and beta-like factor n=1 Tax=Scomber scombrus TaxID=13677 RepID=A0AAV1MXF7_SCOSC